MPYFVKTIIPFLCLMCCEFNFGISPVSASAIEQSDFVYVEDEQKVSDPLLALQQFRQQTARTYRQPFNVGNVDQYFWFYSHLKNKGDAEVSLRLLAKLPYRQLLNAYIVDEDNGVRQILKEGVNSVFEDREYRHRWQASSLFDVDKDQALTLLVQYHAMGSSYLPLDVLEQQEFLQQIHDDTVSAALFYSFSVAAILLFLLFGIAMRDRSSILYAALFIIALLMLSAMEGYAFMYLWPDQPGWNHFSAVVLAYLFCSFGFYVASSAVEPSRQLQLISVNASRVFKFLSLISLLMSVMVFYLPFVMMVNLTSLFVAMMFIAHAYTIIGWSRSEDGLLRTGGLKRNYIATISAVLIALAVVVLILLSLDVSLFPAYVYVQSSRIIFILAGVATMATIIAHVSGLRQDYASSLEKEVVAAKRQAEMNRELLLAEQNYSKVKALAALRQQQLAEASHDMRQPLVSLRSTMDALQDSQQTTKESLALKEQLNNAFTYLENLCTSYLDETRPQQDSGLTSTSDDDSETETKENYSIDLILQTVNRMFEVDASSKGIQMRTVPSSINISQTPTIVMRIVSNLVSNAIKHCGEAKLLLGVRRNDDGVTIMVVDNGKGISEEVQNSIMHAYEKGPDSSGEGLGLAICKQLAEQNEMQLEISSVPGDGTCCKLKIYYPT